MGQWLATDEEGCHSVVGVASCVRGGIDVEEGCFSVGGLAG